MVELKFHRFWNVSNSAVQFRVIFFPKHKKGGTEFEKFCNLYAKYFRYLRCFFP